MGIKWNQDAKPSEKLLALYTRLLFDGRAASLTELSNELGCSKQAVLRLIDQLEAARFGKLLRSKQGRESLYYLDRPKTLPKISLNAEGLHQLALCRDFMMHLLPESMRKNMDATLHQASAYLPEGVSEMPSIGASKIKGLIDYSPFQDMLQTLIMGIRQHKICEIRYQSSLRGEVRVFLFAPKRLVAYHEVIYFHGWLVSEKGHALYETPTVFALHRLRAINITKHCSQRLPDAEGKSRAFGIIEEEAFTVRVKFAPAAATYVAERMWSDNQKVILHKNGFLTLTMTAQSPSEVVAWVMSFADTAELLAPRWLRDELAQRTQALAARYTQKA